jgi:hypothetical protein
MEKDGLINQLLHRPLDFKNEMLDELIGKGLNFSDIRECTRRIYDLSESQLTETSNANTGMAGKLNRLSTSKRKKVFDRKLKKLKEAEDYRIIYAEGDSWFQFPVFIRDIIDWLNKKEKYIIYSDAYGGDWITNIIYESQYVSALSVLRPGFFLISGGGNDLVGNNRLAIMVSKDYNDPKYSEPAQIVDQSLSQEYKEMIMMAQNHIRKEFYSFLLIIKAQYLLLFRQLYSSGSTQKDIISITQGYDYAIPGDKFNWSFRYPLQPLVNKALDNGGWLLRPLKIRGIFNEDLQRALVMTFIYEFNQIFTSLATEYGFKNVYHIDCRGLAKSEKEWYDELHYKSHIFKKVAKAYEYVIDNHTNNIGKIISVNKMYSSK